MADATGGGRVVTVVLCTGDGVLGALPSFEVSSPWWRDAGDVVAGARAMHGVDVTVLRVLDVTPAPDGLYPVGFPGGGAVTYLAELESEAVALRPVGAVSAPDGAGLGSGLEIRAWPGDPLADHPLRAGFARPGGHRAGLMWAVEALAVRGTPIVGPARQVRTWNLSSIWRLPTDHGDAWLKIVPPFLDVEPRLLGLLDPGVVAPVLATGPGRILLGDVAGDDQYGATGTALTELVRILVRLQSQWMTRTQELITRNIPDRRPPAATPNIEALVDRHRRALPVDEQRRLERLVEGLAARFADLDSCGLESTLVHGDFHPGNVRGTPGGYRILDWSDCAIGHPMLDQLAFTQRLSDDDRVAVESTWEHEWNRHVPGSDARRAATLLRPVTHLLAAVQFQHFVDNIEPDEQRYHAGDPRASLRRAAATTT